MSNPNVVVIVCDTLSNTLDNLDKPESFEFAKLMAGVKINNPSPIAVRLNKQMRQIMANNSNEFESHVKTVAYEKVITAMTNAMKRGLA